MPNVRDATIKMRHLRGTTLQNAACDGVEMHPDAPLVMRALRCRASRIARRTYATHIQNLLKCLKSQCHMLHIAAYDGKT